MKILHFDNDDLENPTGGGQARRTFEINRRLVKMGHEVTVITSPYQGSKNKTKEGIKYVRMGFPTGKLRYISYALLIPFKIWKYKPDLVIEDTVPPFTFVLSQVFTRRPVIALVQNFNAVSASKIHHIPLWIFEKYGAMVYRYFIVLSETMKKKIRSLNKKAQIEVIPNGLDGPKPFTEDHKDYLLFLGRIDYFDKGLDLLLPAMKIVNRSIPGLKLIVAGYGKDEKLLEKKIAETNNPNISYIGKTQGKEKEDLLAECFALVQPSRLEVFPFTILEAAAYGKPVICSGIENLEYVEKNRIGKSFPSFTPESLAENIISLYKDHAGYETIALNAYNWAKGHTWDKLAAEQEKFYRLICAKTNKAN